MDPGLAAAGRENVGAWLTAQEGSIHAQAAEQ